MVPFKLSNGFPGGSAVKSPPVNAGDEVRSQDGENPLEKDMVIHSTILSLEIPRTEESGGPGMGEPGGLPSMGSHRVRHDCSDLAAAAAKKKTMITEQDSFHFPSNSWQSNWKRNKEIMPSPHHNLVLMKENASPKSSPVCTL